MRNKKQVINLLKKELIQFATSCCEYHTPKNLGITITVRKKIKNRYIGFGGPHWGATVEFPEKNELLVSYFAPTRKPQFIKFTHIKGISFNYLLEDEK